MLEKLLSKYRTMHPAAKAALWFIICSFLQKSINIISIPIFTRIMSTTQYGQFTVYRSWLEIFTVITTLRLNYSVFNKGMSTFKSRREDYVCTMQIITSILTSVLLLIYILFHSFINNLTELPSFIMMIIIAELLFTPAIEFWMLKQRYEYKYKDVVICTLLMTTLNVLIGIIAVLNSEEKGYARIISSACVFICFGIPLYYRNIKKARLLFDKELATFAIKFNLPLLFHFFSIYILEQFDRIMIQKMVSFDAAALYGLTSQVGLLMKIFTLSLINALIPWMYDKLEAKKYQVVENVIFLLTIFTASLTIILSIIAPEAIMLFAPSEYYEAIYVVPPIALGTLFQFLYMVYANIEFYYDLNKAAMFISGTAALLNLVLNYFGILWFGYYAAAYTTLICYLGMAAGHFLYMKKGVKRSKNIVLPFPHTKMIILSIVVLLFGILTNILYPYPAVRYVIAIAIIVSMLIKRNRIMGLLQQLKSN